MSTYKNPLGVKDKRITISDWRKSRFLEEFSKHANIGVAAKASGIDRQMHYRWLTDPEYVAAFETATKAACDNIDREIYRRGVEGVKEPVFYNGKRVDHITKYDTTLLIFLAKGLMPGKYKDNYKADISLNGSIKTSHDINLTRLPDAELETLISILTNAGALNALLTPDGEGDIVEPEPDTDGGLGREAEESEK